MGLVDEDTGFYYNIFFQISISKKEFQNKKLREYRVYPQSTGEDTHDNN